MNDSNKPLQMGAINFGPVEGKADSTAPVLVLPVMQNNAMTLHEISLQGQGVRDQLIAAGWTPPALDLADVSGIPWPRASAQPWKDHNTASLVNQLRDCALEFGGTQQLRERISQIVTPLADRLKLQPVAEPAKPGCTCPSGDGSLRWPCPAHPPAQLVQLAETRRNRIYLAGPMTGLPEFNFPAFNAAAAMLRAQGLHVINPAEHGIVDGADWADYLHYDLGRLATCSEIHLLPGWSKSRGAALEAMCAHTLGMTVTYGFGAERVELVDALQVIQSLVVWPDGLAGRVEAALKRIENGHSIHRVPADPTDPDLVLAEVQALIEGRRTPFWLEPKKPTIVDTQPTEGSAPEHVGVDLASAPEKVVIALTAASRDVLLERIRQVDKEGYDPEHDDEHVNDEIAAMAALYVMPEAARDWDTTSTGYGATLSMAMLPVGWIEPRLGDRRGQLVKGAAMVLAEIERLDRAKVAG